MPFIQPSELVEFVFDKIEIQSVGPNSLRIDDKQVLKNSLFKKLITPELLIEVKFPEIIAKSYKNRAEYIDEFNQELHRRAMSKHREKLKKDKGSNKSKFGDHLDYLELIPVVDIETGQRKLLNPKTNSISGVLYDVWEMSVGRALKNEAMGTKINARLTYDPYTLDSNYLQPYEGLGSVLVINTYVPPEWRKKPLTEEEKKDIRCPPLALRLLNHLFPDKDCLEYVLNWLYNALVIRNETYLVLNSAKGVGKGVFTALVKALVGAEHYTEASRGFLESQFNSLLSNKRMVVLDEISVNTPDKVNKLKSYINRYQNIEGKFKNAENIVELFTNFIISNNSTSDMHIESDDRRFSVPDTTEIPLRKSFSAWEIQRLVRYIEEDLDFQRQFGYWIFTKGRSKKYDQFSIWKGPKYNRLVYSSLAEWERFIIELLQESGLGSKFTHRELKRLYTREAGHTNAQMAGKNKIEDLLKNYKIEGQAIGEVSKDEEKNWVVVSVWENGNEGDFDDLLLY